MSCGILGHVGHVVWDTGPRGVTVSCGIPYQYVAMRCGFRYDWVSTGSGPRCATKVLAVFSADAKDFVDAATGGLTGAADLYCCHALFSPAYL